MKNVGKWKISGCFRKRSRGNWSGVPFLSVSAGALFPLREGEENVPGLFPETGWKKACKKGGGWTKINMRGLDGRFLRKPEPIENPIRGFARAAFSFGQTRCLFFRFFFFAAASRFLFASRPFVRLFFSFPPALAVCGWGFAAVSVWQADCAAGFFRVRQACHLGGSLPFSLSDGQVGSRFSRVMPAGGKRDGRLFSIRDVVFRGQGRRL
ncbi:hypothetical protein OFAG_02177 [Oxalobacter formigenes HOxBLS]|uniref:Uncharacterized protein n=1 Tax=Oxalobacter paraformigenes TaxID=556268 RepID=T5LEG2_9BURK|nr:hypothetical protein OFAG_02177 [Oxalobacter paraformigenes]